MKKSIYEICVPITSQEQADRLKAICIEYGLPIWENKLCFTWFNISNNFLTFNYGNKEIGIWDENLNKTQITESDFIQLAKEFKQ